MVGNFLEALYTKVFINIVVEKMQTIVYVEICAKDKVLKSEHKSFETTAINTKMYEYIHAHFKESPFYYVSLLDKSSNQGAIPTCNTEQMNRYRNMSNIEYRCFSKDWAYYTSEYDLEALKHEYRSIGIDFVFSPFVLMANFFHDKIESSFAIFVLVEDNYLSFTIFDHSKLLYAEYLDMHHTKEDDMLIDSSIDEELSFGSDDNSGIDIDEISIDDESISYDDFTNIEDLDDSDTIDEFSEEQEIEETLDREIDISTEGFNEDYQRFSLIQSALNAFYKDPKCDSRFLETIYIADGIATSSDLKSYLEEEMFLNVHVRKIDLNVELCKTAKAEVDAL